MAKSNRNTDNTFSHWYENFYSKILAALLAIIGIFSAGYAVGSKFAESDCRLEKVEMKQEFNQKLEEEKNLRREIEIQYYTQKIEDYQEFAKHIKKGGGNE